MDVKRVEKETIIVGWEIDWTGELFRELSIVF